MKAAIFVLLAAAVLALAIPAHALDPIPSASGFSGFIRAGGGFLKYKSNLVAGNDFMHLGDKTIDSLTGSPDSETSGLPLVNFELAWTFATSRTQITLGSQLEDIARLEIGQQLAVKQELPDKSIVSAGFLFSGVPSQVWKDPYLTGAPRKRTDRNSYGGRFVFDRILGSNLEFRYSYRSIDIDDEQSGTSLPQLSDYDMRLLRRDGDTHKLDLSYRFSFLEKHRLVPSIGYFKENRDGDAMSNDGGEFQLTYLYLGDPVSVIVNGLIGKADYDKRNPIYGKKQKDDIYGAGVQVYYKNPFGWKPFGQENFSVFVSAFYALIDANIDFYDTEAVAGLAGVLWRF